MLLAWLRALLCMAAGGRQALPSAVGKCLPDQRCCLPCQACRQPVSSSQDEPPCNTGSGLCRSFQGSLCPAGDVVEVVYVKQVQTRPIQDYRPQFMNTQVGTCSCRPCEAANGLACWLLVWSSRLEDPSAHMLGQRPRAALDCPALLIAYKCASHLLVQICMFSCCLMRAPWGSQLGS